MTRAVQEHTETLRRRLDALAHKLHATLQSTAKVLGMADAPGEEEFSSVLREMPAFDLGQLTFRLRRPVLLRLLGRTMTTSLVAKRITRLIGPQLGRSLSAYRALLYAWSDKTLGQIQRRFDAYANGYRAQVERSLGKQELPAEREEIVRRDLEALGSVGLPEPVAS